MAIKLIATDLDGTLMSEDHLTISDFTLNVLKTAHQNGVKLAIVTGRPYSLTDYVVNQIPFVDFVISANGASVFDNSKNKTVYTNLIPNNDARKIISYFLTQKVFFEVYIDGASHYQSDFEKYFVGTEFPSEFVKHVMETMYSHDDLLEYLGDRGIEKITLYCLKDEDYPKYISKFNEFDFSSSISFESSLEATSKTAHKGNALKGLSQLLDITPNEIMSFGDAGNDIPMLEYAHYSFAMENATEECKRHARFIAKSNAQDGVAHEIIKYVLNNNEFH